MTVEQSRRSFLIVVIMLSRPDTPALKAATTFCSAQSRVSSERTPELVSDHQKTGIQIAGPGNANGNKMAVGAARPSQTPA